MNPNEINPLKASLSILLLIDLTFPVISKSIFCNFFSPIPLISPFSIKLFNSSNESTKERSNALLGPTPEILFNVLNNFNFSILKKPYNSISLSFNNSSVKTSISFPSTNFSVSLSFKKTSKPIPDFSIVINLLSICLIVPLI